MPQYLNPHPHDLYLVGPDGDAIHIRKGRRVRLPSFFDRYANKSPDGYLVKIEDEIPPTPPTIVRSKRSPPLVRTAAPPIKLAALSTKLTAAREERVSKRIVGRMKRGTETTVSCSKVLTNNVFSISNGIGIGILTYNRPASLQRLVDSIIRHTDLHRTMVFISDDGSTNREQLAYLSQLELRGDIVVLRNQQQLGVAGNSNRLMRCLSRFPKKILLNDDVEILRSEWDTFYFTAMNKTGMHHFCHRQPGVYGAKKGESTAVNGVILSVVDEKPHGAVLAFDDIAFSKVGYFDEQFGKYGAEHVDWSNRVSNSGLQASGYFDVESSDSYFLVHQEQSSVEDRIAKFKRAKVILDTLGVRSSYVEASNNTIVPRISCVIPFRDINRKLSILTVLGNIRSQLYPDIEIIMTEEDDFPKITSSEFLPAKYVFTSGQHGAAFNKSKAFNAGVELCTSDWLVLHDADTLAPNNYFKLVGETLSEVESCHLCGQVLYLNVETTRAINSTGTISHPLCSHIVDYFEGGTIACHRKVYWKIGGFAEEFVGYGCEDNDFYYRLSKTCIWRENRCLDLLHLQHDRIVGWAEYHRKNKELERRLFELSVNDRITRQRQILVQNGRGHCL